MGMFDYVYFSRIFFPYENDNVPEFQTKSLENLLNKYYVDENGNLSVRKFNEFDFDEKIDYNYTGEIKFYVGADTWKALFDEGKLILLKKIK